MPPTRLLWPYERPARSPLVPWARALSRGLLGSESPQQTATLLNQAALLFSHLGIPETARWICHRHIDLFAGAAQADRALLGLALQPAINLGRLDVLGGEHARGRQRFGLAECLAAGRAVRLTEHWRVEAGDWAPLAAAHPGLASTLGTVYVTENVQSWLVEGAYSEALAFTEQAPHRLAHVPWTAISEARVACRVGLGDVTGAAAEATRVAAADEHLAVAVKVHLAAGCQQAGLSGEARRLLADAGDHLVVLRWDSLAADELPRFFPLLETTLRLARAAEVPALAARLAGVLLAAATRAGDEVATLTAIAAVRSCGPEPPARELADRAAALADESDYFVIRARLATPPRAIIGGNLPEYQQLADAVAKATGATHSGGLCPLPERAGAQRGHH